MRKWLTVLMLPALLLASSPAVHAQQGDMEYFASFEGLQRVIARAWTAPITSSSSLETIEINDQGTPAITGRTDSTPSATPVPQSGIGMLAIFVYTFDSDDNAAAGWQRVDAELQETVRRDPRAPMKEDLPLDGVGEKAHGFMGTQTIDNITVTYTFATVQDGPFVYSVTGMFSGVDSASLTREYAELLVGTPVTRDVERYNQNGTSQGGLWHKLNVVLPDMQDGSTITDLIIYPMPEASPDAQLPEPPLLDLDHPDTIAGLEALNQITYTRDNVATPSSSQPGVFRIDTWILTFDSTANANSATTALGNTLIVPFGITSGGASGNDSSNTSYYEGFIQDRSLPAGNGIVYILQFNESVYAVVVYAIDEDPHPIADDFMRVIASDSTIPPADRFPEAGDPVLQGLVPDVTQNATATPTG